MLNKIAQVGLEKFNGDQHLASEFVKGFVKQALNPIPYSNTLRDASGSFDNFSVGGTLLKGLTEAAGKGLGTAAVGLGVAGVGAAVKALSSSSLHTKFLSALENAVQKSVVLRQADPEKVKQYAETVFKFAPNVATDSNLLSSILANAIHGDGIDPMTIRTLSDLEGRFTENQSSVFSPKKYV